MNSLKFNTPHIARNALVGGRQWPEVYDLCYTFLHVHAQRQIWHGRRFFDSRNVQKRGTKSDTSGHCLLVPSGLISLFTF